MRLILASTSPRRADLLREAGIDFDVIAPTAEEIQEPGEAPADFAVRAAADKAESVAATAPAEPYLILAADTVVVIDDHCLGKPQDESDAARMLRLLSGRTHQVMTGVCLLPADRTGNRQAFVASTRVTFHELTDAQIREYIAIGEPMDKAGAYAIQGEGRALVESVEGSYTNVVGLPVERVQEVMASFPD